MASWLPHIPEVRERLALGNFQLGMALFAIAGLGMALALAAPGLMLVAGLPCLGSGSRT